MLTTRTSRTGVLALGAAGALLLAGCSGGDDAAAVVPTPAPTTTASSTAAAASTAAEPTGTAGGAGANGGTGGGGSGGTATGSSTGGSSTRTGSAGCSPDGTGVPAGAVSSPTIDVDGDGRADTQWIQSSADGSVLLGLTTASGATFGATFTSGSPIGRSMLVADATGSGEIVALASDGREAALFVVDGCHLTPATNAQGGQYSFDLGFGTQGTGIGCSAVSGAPGRQLVGLELNTDTSGNPTTVDRTAVELDGTRATNGPSDSIDVRGRSTDDPAVSTARAITCGTRTAAADGVRQPG